MELRTTAPRILRRQRVTTLRPNTQRTFSAPTSAPNIDSARTYCQNLLRTHDYPSYILAPFIHRNARDAYLALRAFNIDIALIDSQVSNVPVGRIRMEYWRSAIDKIFTSIPPAEPVAVLLHKVLDQDRAPLSKGFLTKVINTREQYLGNVSFPTLDALEAYAEGTYSNLHYLLFQAHHLQSVTLDHIASHIGKASGISAVLRGIPLLATPQTNKASVVLPLDVCAEFNLRQEDVMRQGGNAPGLRDAVFKVATLANDHMITARKMLSEAGDEARGAAFSTLLPAVPTALYLERLESADFDPFHISLQKRAWKLPWRAYRSFATKTF